MWFTDIAGLTREQAVEQMVWSAVGSSHRPGGLSARVIVGERGYGRKARDSLGQADGEGRRDHAAPVFFDWVSSSSRGKLNRPPARKLGRALALQIVEGLDRFAVEGAVCGRLRVGGKGSRSRSLPAASSR